MITLGTSGEAQPMARVEWLLFLSYFFNIAPAAQLLYTAVRNQYLCSTEYVLKNVTVSGPKVLWVGRSGDQWLAKDSGWKGAVLADAGADVLLPGSSALKAVEVLVDDTDGVSDLAGVLASYGIANGTGGGFAFVGNKNVLRPDRIRNNFTSLDFPETSSARPDLLMADVIRVLYPFDSRYTTRYWLRNVALGDTQHVLYPNRICAHNASNPQPQAVAYTCGNSIAANYSYPPDFPTRASSSTNSHPSTGGSSAGTEKIVGGIIGGIAASGLLASGLWVWWRRRNGKDVVPNALRRWGIGGPRGLEAKGYPVYPPGPSSLELRETGWDNFREGSMRWSEWDDRSIVNGAGGNEGTLKVLGVVTLEGEVVKPWEDTVGLDAVKVDNRDGEKLKTEIDGPAPSPVSDILTVNAPRADQANGATESFRSFTRTGRAR
ncbi:hypothetical protein M427DRAFT_464369 [Gonapodya prolifera JEL478]|uniref:Uncharacterized protein n=1 Tax=Gonapodya prolifera (strain JEL478) TaxID=1344416 RepID=A0A139A2D8_GONPJ|nr:hypothetical protein M427DRAFT_464369 [Gonapodya prolifera JEL478]|eukprot:KXS10715.1 hypothetical protein M427DRAFT_464369 [Gonapodya prolifera JEL478]